VRAEAYELARMVPVVAATNATEHAAMRAQMDRIEASIERLVRRNSKADNAPK
jgi:hypothetical protein